MNSINNEALLNNLLFKTKFVIKIRAGAKHEMQRRGKDWFVVWSCAWN
jgi:hypothetical protein